MDLIGKDLTWKRSISREYMSIEDALELYQDEALLAPHDERIRNLLGLAVLTGEQRYLDTLRREIRIRRLEFIASPAWFMRNLPPAGVLSSSLEGRILLMMLPTGDVLSLPVELEGRNGNILVVGPSGKGKSTFLRNVLIGASGQAIIVAFDRKGDLEMVADIEQRGEVIVLDEEDPSIAVFKLISGMKIEEFIGLMVDLLAHHLHLEASRRLISNILYLIQKRGKNDRFEVSLPEVVNQIEKIKADPTSRYGGYREAALYALKDLSKRTLGILDYRTSNFMERIFAKPRTFIIRTGGIPAQHLSLIVSLFCMYIYEKRRHARENYPPVIIALDDALPMIYGSHREESEGGINPLSNWFFMGRSYGISMITAAQNFSLVSPVIRNNSDTVICFSGFGEDARMISDFMGLTPEQAEILPTLNSGEAIGVARGEWPLAVRGIAPEVFV